MLIHRSIMRVNEKIHVSTQHPAQNDRSTRAGFFLKKEDAVSKRRISYGPTIHLTSIHMASFYWSMVDLQQPSLGIQHSDSAYTYAYTSLSDSFLCCYKLLGIVPWDGIPLNSGIPKTHGENIPENVVLNRHVCHKNRGGKPARAMFAIFYVVGPFYSPSSISSSSPFPYLFVSMSLHSVSRENSWTHPQQRDTSDT